MGNQVSLTACVKKSQQRQPKKPPLSGLYLACRRGDIDKVRRLLTTISIDELNRLESNGSTSLHAASYFGHGEIVELLLKAGASRSVRNLRFNLTPFDEARTEQIRSLFARIYGPTTTRFTGSSSSNEWVLDSSQAAQWKIHLYGLLKPTLAFPEIISYLQQHYLSEHACLTAREGELIGWFFRRAVERDDATYIVQAYTSVTHFYAIVNIHLARGLLKHFRWDTGNTTLEQCLAHLVSIFIYRPDLRSMSFIGTVYRGLLLRPHDLTVYTVGKRLLNKSFLSTSKERRVAAVYAGAGDQQNMRCSIDNAPLQYTALCTYIIRNNNTALDISDISEVQSEQEVLIMPLCAFQVRAMRWNNEANCEIRIEIELEECDETNCNRQQHLQRETKRVVT